MNRRTLLNAFMKTSISLVIGLPFLMKTVKIKPNGISEEARIRGSRLMREYFGHVSKCSQCRKYRGHVEKVSWECDLGTAIRKKYDPDHISRPHYQWDIYKTREK